MLRPAQHIHTPQVQIMPLNTDNARNNKYNWTIICNFSTVQFTTPWYWILRDPKHVGVDF
jgi:hypothetical protein